MIRTVPALRALAALLLPWALAAAGAAAQEIPVQQLDVAEGAPPLLVEGTVTGQGAVDHVLEAGANRILGVDMISTGGVAYFNVLPTGQEEALFIGSIGGDVADVRLPADGSYTIRVYLMGAEADEGATVGYAMAVQLGAPEFADALSGGPDWWAVTGVEVTLNVRRGPSTRHDRVGVLNNGDLLENRGCRMTGDERWCRIRAAHSGLEGWVAGRYLREAAPPQQAAVPEGGPVGNGTPFDATGTLPCATATEPALRDCPFGVIREGPGNAGVWIATGGGAERQFLFEGGLPVATSPAAELVHETDGDLHRIEVEGERYEIPDAVISGG